MKLLADFKCGQCKWWTGILRNKCCIACLVFLTALIAILIAAKITITSILNEVEVRSFNTTFSPLSNGNGSSRENSIEEILVPKKLSQAVSHFLSGFDYENRPVWVIPFGTFDIKGLLNENEENENYLRIYCERGIDRISDSMSLRNSTEWIFIFDMDQYSYSQVASYSTLKFELQVLKKYQPLFEVLAYGFIVNLDYFSRTVVNLAKPILGNAFTRIELIGKDEEKYIEAILKKIPPSQLPEQYGGSKGHVPVRIVD